MKEHSPHKWWQNGIIYQIYPRSFQDSNGDGIGDLNGIVARLDYLRWLGVDAIWISPIYPSPMADFGYDVADYTDIHPMFGDLADFDRLVDEAHDRDIKVLLDFVPNHTSDQHPWFVEARSSRENPKRDWYIWRDPAPGGGPPNNWISNFGGSAWELDETTGQYHYHAFLKEQPDLNWRNPEVRRAMLDVLRFWFERGVDGFRIDVLWHLIKDAAFTDNPPNPRYTQDMPPVFALLQTHTTDRPEVFEIVAEMRRIADGYGERVLIGEIYLPIERLVAYYGHEGEGAHLPFNFHLLLTRWTAPALAALIEKYEAALPAHGWPNWVLSNHDRPRVASRVGAENARLAAMLLLTLRGTPTLYYGDELGMQDGVISPEQVQDPLEKRVAGFGIGRDPARTPMQWDGTPNAGFSKAAPWLPVSADYETVNVVAERGDPTSTLSLYRALIDLRRVEKALSVGAYRSEHDGEDTLMYTRSHDDSTWLVALNFAGGSRRVELPMGFTRVDIALSTLLDRSGVHKDAIELRPCEGVVGRVVPSDEM
jgi:alpha-glucosidase